MNPPNPYRFHLANKDNDLPNCDVCRNPQATPFHVQIVFGKITTAFPFHLFRGEQFKALRKLHIMSATIPVYLGHIHLTTSVKPENGAQPLSQRNSSLRAIPSAWPSSHIYTYVCTSLCIYTSRWNICVGTNQA